MSLSADDVQALLKNRQTRDARLSEEQQASNKALMMELMGDEDKRNAMMAQSADNFKACDVDGDGELNWEEYLAFGKLSNEKAAEKGWATSELIESEVAEMFELHKRASGSTTGVTGEGLKTAMAAVGAAMKAAAGQ